MDAMGPSRIRVAAVLATAALVVTAAGPVRTDGSGEVGLSSDEFKALDTFEAHTLTKADAAYAKGEYPHAYALYEEFLLSFERSGALPYAVLRKARCLHQVDKRFDAIKWYQEVLDYWPGRTAFAAAAKYYIGLCHWQNGDEDPAMKTWAELAEDARYRTHPLAAEAINRLGDYLVRAGQAERAAGYFRQVAVDFRTKNPAASREAMYRVIEHHVRADPDEPALREFYKAMETFYEQPRQVPEDLAADRRYWDTVRHYVRRHGRFDRGQTELRGLYYGYWAKALDGKFPDHDSYQIEVTRFHLLADGDEAAWTKRLDEQFARGQKPGDWGRIVRWIGLFSRHPDKAMAYYEKLDFGRMDNADVEPLVFLCYGSLGKPDLGKNTFDKLKLDRYDDDRKAEMAAAFYQKDEDVVRTLCRSMKDTERGRMELLRFCSATGRYEEGLKLAEDLVGVPRFSTEALQIKAGMHEKQKQWAEALACWRQINQPPATSYRIATCHYEMGQLKQAVSELRQVENYFPDHASQACLKVAMLYEKAGVEQDAIRVFKEVMRKYPDTRESERAHVELEDRGVVVIRGGVDAEE